MIGRYASSNTRFLAILASALLARLLGRNPLRPMASHPAWSVSDRVEREAEASRAGE